MADVITAEVDFGANGIKSVFGDMTKELRVLSKDLKISVTGKGGFEKILPKTDKIKPLTEKDLIKSNNSLFGKLGRYLRTSTGQSRMESVVDEEGNVGEVEVANDKDQMSGMGKAMKGFGNIFKGVISGLGIASGIGIIVQALMSFKPLVNLVQKIIDVLAKFLQPIVEILFVFLLPVLGLLMPILKLFNLMMMPFRKAAYKLAGESMKNISEGMISGDAGQMGQGFTQALLAGGTLFMGIQVAMLKALIEFAKILNSLLAGIVGLLLKGLALLLGGIGKALDTMIKVASFGMSNTNYGEKIAATGGALAGGFDTLMHNSNEMLGKLGDVATGMIGEGLTNAAKLTGVDISSEMEGTQTTDMNLAEVLITGLMGVGLAIETTVAEIKNIWTTAAYDSVEGLGNAFDTARSRVEQIGTGAVDALWSAAEIAANGTDNIADFTKVMGGVWDTAVAGINDIVDTTGASTKLGEIIEKMLEEAVDDNVKKNPLVMDMPDLGNETVSGEKGGLKGERTAIDDVGEKEDGPAWYSKLWEATKATFDLLIPDMFTDLGTLLVDAGIAFGTLLTDSQKSFTGIDIATDGTITHLNAANAAVVGVQTVIDSLKGKTVVIKVKYVEEGDKP